MAGIVRKLVASNKRRFVQDGFALDLSYISPRIIAMGLPAEGSERLYRNPLSEIVRFLTTYHAGGKAKVFNLCAERCYSPAKLMVPVVTFPFEDHQTPSLELIRSFCTEATEWLRSAPDAVIVVHCKAGKGRTGLMVCCLLLSIAAGPDPGLANTAFGGPAWRPLDVNLGLDGDPVEDVLRLYASRRTLDGKGVTIASQRRYVRYFWDVLRRGGQLPPRRAIRLRRISFSGLPPGTADSCTLAVTYRPQGSPPCLPPSMFYFHGPGKQGASCLSPCVGAVRGGDGPRVEAGPAGDWLQVVLPAGASDEGGGIADFPGSGGSCCEFEYVVEGDVRVQLLRNGSSLCYTWFNTAYLPSDGHYALLRQKLDKVYVASDALALSLTFEDAPLAAVSASHAAQPTAGITRQTQHANQHPLQQPPALQQAQSLQPAPGSSKLSGSGLTSSMSLPGSIGAFAGKGAAAMWPWAGSTAAAADAKDASDSAGPWAKDACIELPVISAQCGRSSLSDDDVVAAVMWSKASSAACHSPAQSPQQPATVIEDVAVDWCGRVVGRGQQQHEGADGGSGDDWDVPGVPACGSPISRLGSLLDSLELGWNAMPALQRARSAPTTPRGGLPQRPPPASRGQRSLPSNGSRPSSAFGMCTPLLTSASAAYLSISVGTAAFLAGDMAVLHGTKRSKAGTHPVTPCPSPTKTDTSVITPCQSATSAATSTLLPSTDSAEAMAEMAVAVAAAIPEADELGPFGTTSAPPSVCNASPATAAQSSASSRGMTQAAARGSRNTRVPSPLLLRHLSEPNPTTADLISFEDTADAAAKTPDASSFQLQMSAKVCKEAYVTAHSTAATAVSAGASAVEALAKAAAPANTGSRTASVPPAWRRTSMSPKQPTRPLVLQPQTPTDVCRADQGSAAQHMLQGRISIDSGFNAMVATQAHGRFQAAARKPHVSDSDMQALLPHMAQPDDKQQQRMADAGPVWQQLDEAWSQRWWV